MKTGLEVIKLDFILNSNLSAIIACLRTRVRKQPIVMLYFESETVLKFDNLVAWSVVWSGLLLFNETARKILALL